MAELKKLFFILCISVFPVWLENKVLLDNYQEKLSDSVNFNFELLNFKDENQFSKTYFKNLNISQDSKENIYEWSQVSSFPFTELILSWNSFRPKTGEYSFFVSVRYDGRWSDWSKIASWGNKKQKTFSNNKNRFVHIKHVRLEMQKRKANAFKIRVVAKHGANLSDVKVLFACVSDWHNFKLSKKVLNHPSVVIKGVPKVSQWHVNHNRTKDLCSPTSTSMILEYYTEKGLFSNNSRDLKEYVPYFAERVHDQSYLNIYGAWPLNVAQVFQESKGKLFARVQRLNGVNELYSYIARNIPVAVSVRGYLPGAYKSYDNGHFIVVVGWDKAKNAFLCIDPAFPERLTRAYKLPGFIRAWGRSVSPNLAYIMTPRRIIS
ncbi:MAG: hypothetical protein SZ59_C0002G0119 [candidate division TM6 bacterium GW2011_GWF2_28_16]|nr:MAG: hypothetical protein SZ59_C0002G0119 [candidate division TM6 bacterium GW2011_GWF2_28_16]